MPLCHKCATKNADFARFCKVFTLKKKAVKMAESPVKSRVSAIFKGMRLEGLEPSTT